MPTKWVVTTPGDHVELDQARQGQVTFTVTNPTDRPDRVVFDVVPQEGADPSWFSVDEPQRRVPAAGSVSYVVKTAVPQQARPGSYSLQGRAYSADSAPEEDSVLSSRLAVEVKPEAAPPPRKKFPWWIVVVAALVVIVLVVVLVLVLRGGSKPNTAPSAPPGGLVTMPDLSNQSGQQANTNIVAFGLTVGTVRYALTATPNHVLYQSVAGGAKVARGTKVDLVVSTALAKPVLTAPANGAVVKQAAVTLQTTPVPATPVIPASGSPAPAPARPAPGILATLTTPVITWTDSDPFVKRWQVSIQQRLCVTAPPFTNGCATGAITMLAEVDRPAYTPILPLVGQTVVPPAAVTLADSFVVIIQAVDDFGHVGPYSDAVTFTVAA
jgi:hypothetical protein